MSISHAIRTVVMVEWSYLIRQAFGNEYVPTTCQKLTASFPISTSPIATCTRTRFSYTAIEKIAIFL